jgi:alanyl-tRNA synthetase
MTTKLFWENPYSTECNAIVTSVESNNVKLDKTVFYAFSGGQESDEGTIGNLKVIKAVKIGDKENIIDIEYELEKTPDFKAGDTVIVRIIPERRNKLMRLHSAAHIVYYFTTAKLGRLKLIGSNISVEKARFDFIYETPINDAVQEIENNVNTFLAENHPIITEPDNAKPDLRWWRCGEWKMPCGGTHPKSTSEIGKITLKRKNIGSGKERIEIYLQ